MVLEVAAGYLERLEPESIELDALPEEELVFVVRVGSEPPTGLVRGVLVDELDGSPVPYAWLEVDGGGTIETDAAGSFVTTKLHAAGILDFRVHPGSWDIEVPFDPTDAEPLLVPARVGPTIHVEIGRAVGHVSAAWQPEATTPGSPAIALRGGECFVRRPTPAFVRLPARERPGAPSGSLVLWSPADSVAASVKLAPGVGTRDEPLRVEMKSCAFIQVVLENGGRPVEWHEEVVLALRSAHGGPEAPFIASGTTSLAAFQLGGSLLEARLDEILFGATSLAVFQPGDYLLEARLDELVLAATPVHVVLGKPQRIVLAVQVPEDEPVPETEVERVPLRGRLKSRANRATPGQVFLIRAADGEDAALELAWAKEEGHWLATFGGEVPRGECDVQLDLEPPYSWSGPRTLRMPSSAELHLTLNDDVPLIDVFLEPTASEDGTPVLAYYADLVLDHGGMFAGEAFGSPGRAIVEGHPSDVPFTWLCLSAGRQAASGRYEGRREGGEVRIPVPLARGWGAFLYVGGADREPLAGVEVLLDGRSHATTGTNGYVALASEFRPSILSVRYRDWKLWDGRVEADGSFDDSEFWLNAFLSPPNR